ncbi:MAG: bifunctional glycosyltransferase family 2/GtrA family protein [Coprococcus catus]|nr:bifunctional glycosyltransferase family 2/GtrA family protein [Bariatricus sp.]MDY5989327.1 bifunctional glycosyltransferase family 2/GtrA family protein [Coprococcus catus]
MDKNYVALIPAYKPGDYLLDLTVKLKGKGFSVVIVDDGSGADYADFFLASTCFAEVLHHSENMGKGRALKTGINAISRYCTSDTVIVTVDADGQHCVEDALAICNIAQKAPNTLVLGSRKLKENVPLRSKFGNTVTRFVYYISTGLKVHDTQTGLRAFRAELIPVLRDIPGERYEYEMNVLLRFARDKIRILEHEIETIYIDNNAQSHFDTVKDSVRIYKEILKFSASSFVGFLVDYSLYSLLLFITNNLCIANVAARIVSASVNFFLNRKFVFKSRGPLLRAALQYFLLAAGILIGNTFVLEFIVNAYGVNQMLAKIMTEVMFFILSWLIQKLIVFKRRAGGVC